MPFIEILGPPASAPAREAIARAVTGAVCGAFGVGSGTVTLYFMDVAAYAHEGRMHERGEGWRVFAKVHAYRRDAAARRRAAAALTAPLSELYGVKPDAVAIYFFDRAGDEVAHGGRLSCDAEPV